MCEKERWRLVEVPEHEEYVFTETPIEIIYKYERIKCTIYTETGSPGGKIKGTESVIYGEDSTPENIVIIADPGYVIERIIVDDREIILPTPTETLILDNFVNVKEDHNVKVFFKEKIENPTTKNNIKFIVLICTLISILGLLIKKKVLN